MKAVFVIKITKGFVICRLKNWSICLKRIYSITLLKSTPNASSLILLDIAINVSFALKTPYFRDEVFMFRSINENLGLISYQWIIFCLYNITSSIDFLRLQSVLQRRHFWNGSFLSFVGHSHKSTNALMFWLTIGVEKCHTSSFWVGRIIRHLWVCFCIISFIYTKKWLIIYLMTLSTNRVRGRVLLLYRILSNQTGSIAKTIVIWIVKSILI